MIPKNCVKKDGPFEGIPMLKGGKDVKVTCKIHGKVPLMQKNNYETRRMTIYCPHCGVTE